MHLQNPLGTQAELAASPSRVPLDISIIFRHPVLFNKQLGKQIIQREYHRKHGRIRQSGEGQATVIIHFIHYIHFILFIFIFRMLGIQTGKQIFQRRYCGDMVYMKPTRQVNL